MSTIDPAQIARSITTQGSLYALLRNRLGLNVNAPIKPQELSCTVAPDRELVVSTHMPIAGFPVDHGTVANEAAMLALHTLDSATLLAEPTFVAPGDSCLRADDPGWRWHCISGHGQALTDWERRPLGGALEGLSVSGHTHAISAIPGLQTELDALSDACDSMAPLTSPALTGTPTAPTPLASDSSTRLATTAMVHAVIAGAGGGGGGGTPSIKTGLQWWVVADESSQPVDLHAGRAWAWQGTAASGAGKIARALQFTAASTSRITSPYLSDHTHLTGFAFFGWAQYVGPATNGYILGTSSATDASADRSLYVFANPGLGDREIAIYYGDGSANVSATPPSIASSGWFPVASSYDPMTGMILSMRLDGSISSSDLRIAETGSGITGSWAPRPRLLASGSMQIGNLPNTKGYYSAKMIDSMALWARPLTAAELERLYNAGAGLAYGDL